jgi:hypothetical protein
MAEPVAAWKRFFMCTPGASARRASPTSHREQSILALPPRRLERRREGRQVPDGWDGHTRTSHLLRRGTSCAAHRTPISCVAHPSGWGLKQRVSNFCHGERSRTMNRVDVAHPSTTLRMTRTVSVGPLCDQGDLELNAAGRRTWFNQHPLGVLHTIP